MNYSELTQAIKDYTENTESTFTTNIPVFVRQAEERIMRSVIIPELRKNVTGSVTSGNQYLARPSDFLSMFSISVLLTITILFATLLFCVKYCMT